MTSTAAIFWSTGRISRDVEVKVEGSMWSWRFTHPNGVESYNELRVEAGKPVVVRMTSADAVHSFFMPDFRIKEDLMPVMVAE